MGSSDTKPRPAYVHDADENEEPISGTRRTARKSSGSHRRPEEKRKSKSDTGTKIYEHVLSSAKRVEVQEPEPKLERRKSSASSKSPSKSHTRPPSAHGNRPKLSIPKDHPSHFGISSMGTPVARGPPVVQQYPMLAQPIPLRPRPTVTQAYNSRPGSYHAYMNGYQTAGPPIANSAYYQPQMAAPSYPPPSPASSFMRYAATPQPEYFPPQPMIAGRPLSSRFDTIPRSSSAFAMRDVRESPILQQQYQLEDVYDAGYISSSEQPMARRRASIRIPTARPSLRSKAEIDYETMPPPPRPQGILRNKTTEYHPELPDPPRERRHSRTLYREETPSRRPSTHRNSVSYDFGPESDPIRVETANTSHRRQSYYGQSASLNSGSGTGSGSGWEEQAKAAQSYQADVGASAPLTTEMLNRQQRHQGGSSRSTKSSGSHDESDFRRSATTRTTRSGSGQGGGDDGFTIKVKGGQARVMVEGAQIDCTEGGEIQIQRQKSIRNGSERSGSEYGSSRIDDRERRPRIDRAPGRSRRSSVGGHSHSRIAPEYHAPKDYTKDYRQEWI